MSWQMNRRQVLSLGTTLAAGAIAAGPLRGQGGSSADSPIWKDIENIIEAEGMFQNGVFSIEIDRNDLSDVTLHGVPIKPSFQINGTVVFQQFGDDTVMMNADMALKPGEINPFIDRLLSHQIVFQAEHQHMYDFDPIVWFIHFRKMGNATDVARGVKAALDATSTPFPQMMPSNPTTPLPADEMGRIIGASPTIGADGVVTYDVPRKETITLGGVRISPFLNVEAPIAFQPLNGGKTAAAVPDFNLIASEIVPVVKVMREAGWDIGCLYNQETAESPQLYFSHQFKTGDPLRLAREIRNGLNLMNVQLM